MYRNCFYNNVRGEIVLFTWDSQGKRITEHVPFEPYLYIESQSHNDATSIYNTPLRKLSFRKQFDRFRFVQDSSIKRIFYNLPPEQQFLIENYRTQNNSLDFTKNPLKIFSLDIEVVAPEFPNPTIAKDPINVITVHDSLTDHFTTWGLYKDFKTTHPNSTYIKCSTEKELLLKFIDYWTTDYPDIVTGWASETFDIPYIINRIINLFDEDKAKLLSPVHSIWYKKGIIKRFGRVEGRWSIRGVSCIDYMEAYRVFSRTQQESYGLGNVAESELGIGKKKVLATNLATTAQNNWQEFVEYNIQDVYLLAKLEEKLQFLALTRMLAYVGLTNFEQAMGTISVVTGALAIKGLERNQIISTFAHRTAGDYEGAFVRDPIRGMHEAVVTFDVNSLYPNTVVSLNLSPETKVGKINSQNDDQISFSLVKGKTYVVNQEEFNKFLDEGKIAVSKSNVLFSQEKKGMCPELIDGIYKQRVDTRKKLKSLKRIMSKIEDETSEEYLKAKFTSEQLDIKQYTLKIFLNRIYGFFGNRHSPFYDVDLASSITLTGQACIKEANNIANNYIKKTYGIDTDCTIYNDTDSLYLSIHPILKKLNQPLAVKNKVTVEAHKVVDTLEETLNDGIQKWTTTELHSLDSRLEFKREAICDVGIFLEKKRYILHVLDDEGIATSKTKYVGVEVASTSIPKKVKVLIKQVVETMIRTKSQTETNHMFDKAYEEFKKLNIEDVAFPRGINKLEKYTAMATDLNTGKGTPCHVKAAIAYNYFLSKLNLTSQYEQIRSGNKIKFFYATTNPWRVQAVAFIDQYPAEFTLQPDYDKMFDKSVTAAVERLYNVVKWRVVPPTRARETDLFELFK